MTRVNMKARVTVTLKSGILDPQGKAIEGARKSAVVADPAIRGYDGRLGSPEDTKMADVTPELMFEVLKSVQARLAQVDGKVDELRHGVQALGTSQNAIRQEITGIHEEMLGIH